MHLSYIEHKHQFDNDDDGRTRCHFCDKILYKDQDDYVTLKSGEIICESCMLEVEEE